MDISKVVYGDTTLIDLTEDTVTADSMLSGVTAHGANGEQIYGTMSQVTPATATPLMDGTAAVGTSIKYAREDHVHPHDSSIPTKVSDLTNDSGFIAAPSANVDEVIAYNGTTWVADKRMVILSYGSSTWTDFINAYNSNAVVYCRASSNSNPASGAQTRMAFMAYVNSATPTNVEFQYYRSVSSHTDSQQGDQVFIYKLDKTAGWSVTTRNSFTKIAAGTGLSSSYASQTLTLTNSLQPATATPLMNGTAAVGISDKYAKEDHVHPLYDQFVRPNLLDNWYFVGGGSQLGSGVFPINSNGKTSYSGASYWIDRWKSTDSNLNGSVNGDYIRLTKAALNGHSPLIQVVPHEELVGQKVTVSVLYRGSISGTARFIFPWGSQDDLPSSNDWTLYSATGTAALRTFGGYTDVILTGFQLRSDFTLASYLDIKAVKLEVGDTQTLAHQVNGTWVLNEIPNFNEQLIRCKTSTADPDDPYANQDVMTNTMVVNPNLLDNWYFDGGGSQNGAFPINTRGKTTYTGSQYTIDRWRTWESESTLTVNSGYITFSTGSNGDGLFQYMSNIWQFQNKTFTVSALIDGKIYSVTGKTTSTGWIARNIDNDGSYIAFVLTSSEAHFRISLAPNKTVNIRAVKLEFGTTQTLGREEPGTVGVLNELPNFEEQLNRCRTAASGGSYGDYYSGNRVSYNIPNPNLLVNSYFVGGGSQKGSGHFPINSKGKTVYDDGYGTIIDRWMNLNSEGKVTLLNEGLVFTGKTSDFGYFKQTIEASGLSGDRYLTLSLIADGVLYSTTFQYSSGGNLTLPNGLFIYMQGNSPEPHIRTPKTTTDSAVISAIKLELGTIQTLAHSENGAWVLNEIPNYDEELLRCRTSAYRTVNKNLLDNWYFVGGGSQQGGEQFPINQRGQTNYGAATYTIDRWFNENSNAAMQVNSNSITFSESSGSSYAVLLQLCSRATLDNLLGKVATFSVLTTGGLYTRTFTFPTNTSTNFESQNLLIAPGVVACVSLFFANQSYQLCRIVATDGSSVNLVAVKLELGDTQTLAHQENGTWVLNELPNYEEQLLRCNTSIASSSDTYANKVVAYTPKNASITLASANWTGNGPYTQTVTISGATITSNTLVDLRPDATTMTQLIADGTAALFVENNAGTLTAYAISVAPTVNLTVQCTLTEVT